MSDDDDQPPGPVPLTDEGRALLELYAALDEADRVLLWCRLLTLLERQRDREQAAPEGGGSRP